MSYDEKHLSQLLRNLKNRDGFVRSQAASRLGELKAKEAVEELARLLKEDRDSLVRSSAAAALGDLGDEAQEAVATLLETIESDRIVGVRLESIGSDDAVPGLTKIALEDDDIRVRSWAADALRKIKD